MQGCDGADLAVGVRVAQLELITAACELAGRVARVVLLRQFHVESELFGRQENESDAELVAQLTD